jgi:hypothetical protein
VSAPRRGILAEFAGAGEMVAALRALRAEGYRRLDTVSPRRVPEAEPLLEPAGGGVVGWAGAAAVAGLAFALWVQGYTSALEYPLIVGGRPRLSWPAWVPIAFTTAVLLAAVAAFLRWLVLLRLPALAHPLLEVEGAGRGAGFWVMVAADDPRYHALETETRLRALGALRVARLWEDR